ncbi:MAG: hypothetical protein AAGB46_02465 [Verrucomicrobiota bacterium]
MKNLGLFLIAVSLCQFGIGQSEPVSKEEVYVFRGVDLTVKFKSQYSHVVLADKKGLHIETDKGTKRVRYSAKCRFLNKIGISNTLVAIEDYDISFDYAKQAQLEAAAVSDMFRSEAQTDIEIARLGGGALMESRMRLSSEARDEIEDLQNSQMDLEEQVRLSIESGDFGNTELRDFISVKMNLVAPRDIENAYCAVVVRYRGRDRNRTQETVPMSIGKVKRVGDLLADIPEKLQFSFVVPEGFISEDDCEFYLFSGKGINLATSRSVGLKQLSDEEIERIKSLAK